MLIENMKMAFSAIRSNKMRSALTMLGIIIGIGSVIAIVSIGDTMRGLFSDLYKDVGITQAYVSVGYWLDDTRQSDYFTLDEMERAREAFKDQIAYIDSNAYTSSDAEYKRTKIKFDYQGIDYNYQDVQPRFNILGSCLVACCEAVDKGIIHAADESDGLSVPHLAVCLFLFCQGCQGACKKCSLLLLTGIGGHIGEVGRGV